MQLIVAGKSHPADDGGKALIQQIVRFADRPEVRHRIAFLPDYDMSMARLLYWGCDVWLNNPLRPAGGVRHVGDEERAQRRAEPVDPRRLVGRVVRRRERLGDPDRRRAGRRDPPRRPRGRRALRPARELGDDRRSTTATSTASRRRWVEMVRHTLQALGPKVLASRMVRDYTEKYYAPAAQSLHRTIEDSRRRAVRCRPRAGRLPAAGRGGVAARSRSPTWTATGCPTPRCSARS